MAKFIAQIETGTNWLISTSEPAEATSPARVRMSGSPAATRAPKASTRIASVTGQENISDLSIALRLASLKSDQSREAPVGLTWTPVVESVLQRSLEVIGRPDHLVGICTGPGQEDGGLAVLAQRRAGLWLDDVGDPRVGLQHGGGLGQNLLAGAGGDRAVGAVHDDLDRGAGVAAEVVLGELTGRDGLGAVGLPAGAGELGLDLRGEGAQADDEQDPHHAGQAGVVGDPDPEATQRTGAVAQVGVRGGGTGVAAGSRHGHGEALPVEWCRAKRVVRRGRVGRGRRCTRRRRARAR